MIIFVLIVWVYSAPSITGILSGVVYDGESVTISGTGFGSGPANVLFDDFEHAGASSGSVIQYSSAKHGSWTGMHNYDPLYTTESHSGSYGMLAYNDGVGYRGIYLDWASSVGHVNEVYVSYWNRIPTGTYFPGATTVRTLPVGTPTQWCLSEVSDGYRNGDVAFMYQYNCWRYYGLDVGYPTLFRCWGNYLPGGVGNNYNFDDWQRFSHYYWSDGTANPTGTILFENLHPQGMAERSYVNQWQMFDAADAEKGYTKAYFPGYTQKTRSSQSNVAITYDDIYIAYGANARARVEIGNVGTYGTSLRNAAVQIPTQWSNTQITFKVNFGSFSSNEDVYLFVIDSVGGESTGYSITLADPPGVTCSPTCSSHGTCTDGSPPYCSCQSGYTGQTCDTFDCTPTCGTHADCVGPNNCDCHAGWSPDPTCDTPLCSPSCGTHGTCTSPNDCTCDSGWIGTYCTSPSCIPACSTHGSCVAPNTCDCQSGWTGADCDTFECSPSCIHGSCTGPNTCSCTIGWGGAICNTPLCSPTCLNGGSCISPDSCSCLSGWSGTYCQTPTCSPSCGAHGSCSSPNVCTCDTDWIGTYCTTPVCSPSCVNGNCVAPDDCNCNTGWIGALCDTPECVPVCSSHGTCTAPNTCTCESGYGGSTCSESDCDCVHGSCVSPNVCGPCDSGWTGTKCEIPVCSPVCSSHGTCTLPDNCVCDPPEDWSGALCDQPACVPSCGAHGTCTAIDTCTCDSGYTGTYCDQPTCTPACGTHGTCTGVNTCTCSPGYSNPPQCADANCDPSCQNGGSCTAPNTCTCANGWTGGSCETPVCDPVCVRGDCVAPFTCECYSGWGGQLCDLVECYGFLVEQVGVCSGHGACIGPDTCQCFTNWRGDLCQFEIFPGVTCYGILSSYPGVCSGHGTCGPNEDDCHCVEGWFGEQCANEIVCNGVRWDNSSICSGHGECKCGDDEDERRAASDECECKCEKTPIHYQGDNCERPKSADATVAIAIGSAVGGVAAIAIGVALTVTLLVAVCCCLSKLRTKDEYVLYDDESEEMSSEELEVMKAEVKKFQAYYQSGSAAPAKTSMFPKKSIPSPPVKKFTPPVKKFSPPALPKKQQSSFGVKKFPAPPPKPSGFQNRRPGGTYGNFKKKKPQFQGSRFGTGNVRKPPGGGQFSRNKRAPPGVPGRRPPAPRKRVGPKPLPPGCVRVVQQYDATRDDELSVRMGDVVKVISREGDGWFYGELRGKKGYLPGNYTKEK